MIRIAIVEDAAFDRQVLRDCLRHRSRSCMTLFGIIGCVLSALCLGRVVFSKFWNKYLSHVPEMALLTVVWFLIILARFLYYIGCNKIKAYELSD